ncbi:F-type H+-transporting ATPase subunit gamma [Streptomyces sp. DvalAA-14]|uniref:F0F1 ATP synthase subunit gamma n=1 Tax=unclassified Streptomyces TaxID=2593676 RepID=UPI00081B566F|nr:MULTISPECIES: F0F1 ATP synthase subunit gamma [unclassified Streptomyces]MYS20771.1 F0F1 ATP synthase subunit gamma [Streptomyces sp. SID4948]SCD76857.1 F-type H+-transporting ATPase subunit gamma [Streptomyces sp. DvalAA-14]
MGAQLRVYKRRIKSITATKKITKAMEMISASRILKAQRQVAASSPYADELTRAVTAVATGSNTKHPLTTETENPTRAAVLLITSDRGLAGGYSANAIKAAERLTERLRSEGKEVDHYLVGRKALAYYGFRERPVAQSWTGFSDSPQYGNAKEVAAPLIESVQQETADGGVDELHIVFTEFVSMMTQTPVTRRLLPLSLDEVAAQEQAENTGKILPLYEFEPSAEGVLDALLPRYVESRVYNALLQAAASEHAARRRAMKSATDNAEDLIKSLTRLANAARQADITQEISEIVGGASALADASAGSD